ncbi:ATP-grasp domain-containing protein [Halomonas beimenensis]
MNPYAPALGDADESIVLPSLAHDNYVDDLLSYCRRRSVKMLFSLNDDELALLAECKESFARLGTRVVLSSPEVIDICSDKVKTFEFSREIGVSAPQCYRDLASARQALERGHIHFPLFIKPRWGTASLCVEKVLDDEELEWAWRFGNRKLSRLGLRREETGIGGLIIQGALQGDEYGLDVINDLDGNYRATFVKKKLSMRSGETERAVTKDNSMLLELGERLGRRLNHVGVLDCDVILNGNKCHVIDLNPRFGGGYPFADVAGARVPEALIAWHKGKIAPYDWNTVRPGVVSSKYDCIQTVDHASPLI